MAEYVCKYCGTKTSNPAGSSGSYCPGPYKRHEWTDAKEEHVCKYCGTKTSNPAGSSGSYCSQGPNNRHEWL